MYGKIMSGKRVFYWALYSRVLKVCDVEYVKHLEPLWPAKKRDMKAYHIITFFIIIICKDEEPKKYWQKKKLFRDEI